MAQYFQVVILIFCRTVPALNMLIWSMATSSGTTEHKTVFTARIHGLQASIPSTFQSDRSDLVGRFHNN